MENRIKELQKTTRSMTYQSEDYKTAAAILKKKKKKIICDHQWAYSPKLSIDKAKTRKCILCTQIQVFRTKWSDIYKGMKE